MKLYYNQGYFIPIAISNPLKKARYPERGAVLALIDTGFDGFLLIPKDIFQAVQAIPVEKATIEGVCCETTAIVAPIRIIIEELNLAIDGECITYEESKEIIIGSPLWISSEYEIF